MLQGVEEDFRFAEPNARFNGIIQAQKQKQLRFSTLIKFSLPFIIPVSILCVLNSGFSILSAYVTSVLIDWVQKEKPDMLSGGLLTLLVVLLINLKVLCYNWYNKTFYETEKHILNGLRVGYEEI